MLTTNGSLVNYEKSVLVCIPSGVHHHEAANDHEGDFNGQQEKGKQYQPNISQIKRWYLKHGPHVYTYKV